LNTALIVILVFIGFSLAYRFYTAGISKMLWVRMTARQHPPMP